MNQRYLIIVAEFTRSISDKLLDGAKETFFEAGLEETQVDVLRVPGCFELPVVAMKAARSHAYAAIVCLGCVIRGETTHYDYVAGQAAEGIMRASLETEVPIIFGVVTTENLAQAQARAGGEHGNKGAYAAAAALSMTKTLQELSSKVTR
jgi:6,7-dimethyl-8-ribityllumazine synthase